MCLHFGGWLAEVAMAGVAEFVQAQPDLHFTLGFVTDLVSDLPRHACVWCSIRLHNLRLDL